VIFGIISGSVITAVLLFLDGRKSFNLEKLLHRGKYSIASDHSKKEQLPPTGIKAIIGITDEFTKWDKFIFYASIIWSMFWVSLFVIFTVYALLPDTKLGVDFWAGFWHFKIWLMFLVGIVVTVWLTVGGIKDSIVMFRILKDSGRDLEDDGVIRQDDQTADN
jgi:SSS family solute:Na+ symporter